MLRRKTHADLQRVRHVLADLAFPAAKWQLVTHAEHYGADAGTRADLWALPTGTTYPDLPAVLAALGLCPPSAASRPPAPRAGFRTAPPMQPVVRGRS